MSVIQGELEKVFLYANRILAQDGLLALQDNAQVDARMSQACTDLVLQMRTWCWAGRIPDRVENETITYPDGAWQMFKRDHLPAWFVARFPVRMKTHVVERVRHTYFVCPHMNEPSRETHLKFMATGSAVAPYIGR